MPKFAAFRVLGAKPGCVDFLGVIHAESEGAAEDIARILYDWDWAAGDRLDLELEEESHDEEAGRPAGV